MPGVARLAGACSASGFAALLENPHRPFGCRKNVSCVIIRYINREPLLTLDSMTLATGLPELTQSLSRDQQQTLHQGGVVLAGQAGSYTVWGVIEASPATVWQVLTAYDQFPDFLPSVVSAQILEKDDNRTIVRRKDRRKVGWMPIKVSIVTENIEINQERIDYSMVDGTLDAMEGSWKLAVFTTPQGHEGTLLVQTITARASLGPLQGYFYEVFEQGLRETFAELRQEMEHRAQS